MCVHVFVLFCVCGSVCVSGCHHNSFCRKSLLAAEASLLEHDWCTLNSTPLCNCTQRTQQDSEWISPGWREGGGRESEKERERTYSDRFPEVPRNKSTESIWMWISAGPRYGEVAPSERNQATTASNELVPMKTGKGGGGKRGGGGCITAWSHTLHPALSLSWWWHGQDLTAR